MKPKQTPQPTTSPSAGSVWAEIVDILLDACDDKPVERDPSPCAEISVPID